MKFAVYKTLLFSFLLTGILFQVNCNRSRTPESAGLVREILSEDHFREVMETKGRLLVFDLYAEWCAPCRSLSPMLNEIAGESGKKADFYKINVDKFPGLAASFNVTGIPYVVFIRDKAAVHALTGLYPKNAYVKAVAMYSPNGDTGSGDAETNPDGELVNGVRVIQFAAEVTPRNIYVYQGETVQIVIAPKGYAFSIHIPDFGVSAPSAGREPLTVSFKAENTGVFPVFCNGNCPAGDGAMHAKLIVLRYTGPANEDAYHDISAPQARQMLAENPPLLLDVRTPNEFYDGHIPGAQLIPVQQLAERIGELENYKDKEILIYCRSGNRSVVASEILIQKGFKKILNLQGGINGWMKEHYEIKKTDAPRPPKPQIP